jgi:hypothetical protein
MCLLFVFDSINESAVKVPIGEFVEFAVILHSNFGQLAVSKVSDCSNKFHGQTSTNPALFTRVPLDARVNDKSPDPSVGIAENTVSSLYPDGIITNDAEFNKSLINYRLFNLFNKHETPS